MAIHSGNNSLKPNHMSWLTTILLLIVTLFFITSCSDEPQEKKHVSNQEKAQNKTIHLDKNNKITSTNAVTNKQTQTSQADWESIKESGILRIIVPYSFQKNNFLPRESYSYSNELKSIIRFSEENNLTPVFVSTKYFSNMFSILEQGLGDIVVANLTITEDRKEKFNFTIPVDHSTEQLVVSNLFNEKITLEKLNDLKIGARKNTSFWDTLTTLKEKQAIAGFDNLQIIQLDEKLSSDEKFNQIVLGKVDAVIEDSNRMALFKEYRTDIKTILDLGKERPIAWAVRKNNPDLLKQVNRYIKTEKLLQHLPDTRYGDFDSIKKHRQLRLITRNNASSYFLWKNQLMGFEYELIKQFSKNHKINLKVLVANDFEQMIQWLEQGYGDIISASLIKTPERAQLPIEFTKPYLFVQEVIVQKKDDKTIDSLEDLSNRTFHIRQSSSYWNTLHKLQNKLRADDIHFTIEAVPESMETEEIINNVTKGHFDLTLADSNIVAIEQSWHNELIVSLPLTGEHGQRWLVRKDDTLLLSELNKFIDKEYKQLFYNVTYNKYFKNSRDLFDAEKREKNNNSISIYDDLIKSLAKEYDFDWRLIAAQINKESQFNPKAKSWAGAKGLLQVMPRTAREISITDLETPENGLRAGIKYMAWINDQLSNELPADVQTWFTLAAYNAGLGHLKDARSLASKEGLNPDRWFGNVEKAFLLLSKPKYYKKARYGYVRGTEPVNYVKHIQALYELYSKKHPDEDSV
ncbi:MAG: transporter substrate-binding domain-containing protein [Gammaproteobacteria bacterium]|nr:transporter substrate-binding domain-containing protein [Gammaproteobacteria bacterium]